MHVIATAGHVDHGKSTLVRALTGVDPDRWEEEKQRGMTIDLGFGAATLPSGAELAFVDVPGHVRFIKNMLAGVGGVDACLFVVAATEGWKPQSEEHLRILELLGLRHGMIALTKVGLCDEDLVELARLDVAEHVAGTFLEHAELVEVDVPTGLGVAELQAALDRLAAATPRAVDAGLPRLWVDRAFAAKGSGTVVTGTLTGGSLAVDDELVLLPDGHQVRVRALQSHHHQRATAAPGSRLAVNLVGVAHHDVRRGDVLVRAAQWHRTRTVDASLQVLDSLDHEVSRRGAYVAYLGSGEQPVKLRVLGAHPLAPGESGFVRLYLPVALPLRPGDRFVLRESGRRETVGGGEVLDVAPVLPASRARPDRSVERVIRERGFVDAAELERLTGERREPDLAGWVVDPPRLQELVEEVAALVAGAGPLGLDIVTLDDHRRAALALVPDIKIEAGRVTAVEATDPLADHPYVAALDAEPFAPPPPDGVDRTELRELARRGHIVAQDGIYFSERAVLEAGRVVARLLVERPEGVTVAEVRDAWGCSRKHALPLLALLDGRGMTRRRGDLRIGGPRLPQP
ncbi:MAG: selenocysteine-specific translation elongation factor [Acidimicrobiia bacterium]